MTGPFAQAADDFIQYKRSCGFKYEYEPKCLSRFCRFATDKGVTSVEISRELAEAWIAPRDGESVKSRSHRMTCIRQFAIYLDNLGYAAYILPEQHGTNTCSFVPYIFTHEQINALIMTQHSHGKDREICILHSLLFSVSCMAAAFAYQRCAI